MFTNYKEYLRSDYWLKRREDFKKSTHRRCFICRSKSNLQVHHKRYSFKGKSILFKERNQDFRLLCARCHTKIHETGLEETLSKGLLRRTIIKCIIEGKPWPGYTKI